VRVCLFGPTGSIGRQVLERALEREHEVRVIVGDPVRLPDHGGMLTVIAGDVGDAGKVQRALGGCDAVIDTLGVRANTSAEVERLLSVTKLIISTMERNNVRRFLGVAGAAIDAPGDEKGAGYRLAGWFSRLTSRRAQEEKQLEFDLVSASGLEWTILRVPFVTDGPLTRTYRTSLAGPPSSRISRADIGYALVDQLEERAFVRKAPFIGT
jgi:putative NADH-flavin reductase